jgi:hypothetical protein
VNAALVLPLTLSVLAAVSGIGVIRDVAVRRYRQALAGLLWGLIFVVAIVMSSGPLLALL